MHLRHVALHNFRNFAEVEDIAFPAGALLVAAAPNATGKTNFLESVVMLLRGKSFRAHAEQCVRWGEEGFELKGEAVRRGTPVSIAVRFQQATKKLRLEEDGTPVSPVTLFAHYPLVVFLPEDTFLFTRGPGLRRTFLNHALAGMPAYLSAAVQYHRALKQRNALLKRATEAEALDAWTQLLVEHSQPLWKQRESLAHFFATHLAETYAQLSGEQRAFSVALAAGVPNRDQYQQALEQSRAHERRFGYTLYGPHRDDLVVTSEGRELHATLSRGQLRTVVIALKLITYRFITNTTREEPILLLDEVLSELDETRQTRLLTALPASQTILTCTALPSSLRSRSDVHLLDLREIITPLPAASPVVVEDERVPEATPAVAPSSV